MSQHLALHVLCTDWSLWPLCAFDLTMHGTSCLNLLTKHSQDQSAATVIIILPPLQRNWTYVPMSAPLSVCGHNHVHSVSSTILVGSILYLHIPSSNFRRCVMGNVSLKIKKYVILANSLVLWLWIGLCLTWNPICLNNMGNDEAAGVSSERRGSSCSSY